MNDQTALSTLPEVSRRLRRQLLRHRRLVSALLVGATVLAAVNVWAPSAPPTATVVVAAHDLAGGVTLGAGDLRVVQLDEQLTPSGAAASATAVTGRTVAGPMRAGEIVTDRRLIGPSLLHGYGDGLVAAPLRLTDAGISRLLEVGDHVDVYAATGDITTSALRVVLNASVVALPQPTAGSSDGALVLLVLTDSQAARVAQAVATTQISVVLRAPP